MDRDLDKKLDMLGEWKKRRRGLGRLLVGGDFNAKTRNEGRKLH